MATVQSAAQIRGPIWVAQLFLLSLLIPFHLPMGSVVLMPHRILLLIFFVPFFLKLFIFRRAGPVIAADWLLFGSATWSGLSLIVNKDPGFVEAWGLHMVEFFGAYLLARVSIRSGQDFRRVVWTFFLIVAILLPFAALESVTGRPIMLDLLPGTNIGVVYKEPRWGLRRAQAIFAHPILFGVFVSTGFGLFWYALRPRWLRFVGVPAAVVATVFSLSTGALISVVVQAVFVSWNSVFQVLRWRWKLFSALAVLAYITIDLISNRTPFHVLVTYASFNTGNAYNRILIWYFGIENVADNPIFGLGRNEWVRPEWMSSSADNYWLLLTMQYGLPAIGMILLALFLILRRTSLAVLPNVDDRLARSGYLIAFSGLFIAGCTVHYWHAMMAFSMFIFGSGVWAGTGEGGILQEVSDELRDDTSPRRSRYSRQLETGVPIGPDPVTRRSVARSAHRPVSAGIARTSE